MRKAKIAVIIPAFNEEETIAGVVAAASASELVSEVIVVSDGSADKTARLAKKNGATQIFNLPIKKGKGAAMLHGLTHTDAEIIVFLDADLKGFRAEHLKRLIEPVFRGELVMSVGIRDRGKIMEKIGPYLPLIGGERAMQRFVIENIPDKYLKGFMIESALNYYCRSRELPYGTVFLPGVKIRRKMQKVGVLKGLLQYVKMIYQIIKAMILVRLAKMRGRF
ncbi:glycosyltransferase family 2 protein [Candidatus Parcubacteria bacterium]|nr:glycosyltransferase family 2 protein [Patescibacteria group bacterium]MCG2694274.1 glycosyltransferase family 2 protein [Candidatus Parcubacteria bacterium]